MMCCPGNCHLVQSRAAHCTRACHDALPLDKVAAVETAFLQRARAAERSAVRDNAWQYEEEEEDDVSSVGSVRRAKSKDGGGGGGERESKGDDDGGGDKEEDEEEEEDEDEEENSEGSEDCDGEIEEGVGYVWRAVLCDACGCHPRAYFYHRPPNTDLCKGCFPAVVVQHAVQPTFQRVTRGCPYTGRILESTLVP